MSSLLVFNRVYRLVEIKAFLVVNYCPSKFLSVFRPPPSLCECVYCVLYTRIQCVRGGQYGVIGGERASDR
jgi:hypothetical protein